MEETDYKILYQEEVQKIKGLEQRIEACKKEQEFVAAQVRKYEENGVSKLYYSLSRKAWEMADMLNSINLKNVPLDDPKDKTFERLRYIINDSSGIAVAVKTLGDAAGITGDEDGDIRPRRKMSSPETYAQEIGDNKTQDV